MPLFAPFLWLIANPARLKGAVYGGLLLVALWSFKMWLNARDARAAARAEIRLIQEQIEVKEKELTERIKKLDALESGLAVREEDLGSRLVSVARAEANVKAEVKRGMEAILGEMQRSQNEISTLPPSAVNARFRQELKNLRE